MLALVTTLSLLLAACSGAAQQVASSTSANPVATPASTPSTPSTTRGEVPGAPSTAPAPADIAGSPTTPEPSISVPVPTSASKPATRIVSLSPTATETLFAIGAAQKVVAVDALSSFPSSAPRTTLSGQAVDVGALLEYQPDAVIVETPIAEMAALDASGVRVLVAPPARSLHDVYDQIRSIGALTGHAEQADQLVVGMQAKVTAIVRQAATTRRPLRYFHERNDQLATVTSESFLGQLYTLLHLSSIADALAPTGGEAALTSAQIAAANPDLVFLADVKCCRQTIDTVKHRPGWGAMKAVTSNAVIAIDDDLASRWGPRVVDLLQAVSRRIATLSVG